MLLVNVNTKQFIPSPGSNFIQPVESRDQIILGTRREVRFQLYNTDGTVFALNESDTFCCAGDINFIHTDDLMFYSGHEMCRIIDAAQGIVGVTIDATSDSFAAKATSQNTRMYVQLKRHVAGDTLGDTVLQDIVYAQPAVMTTEGAPASSDPEYMTAAATLALLRTAPDYQFSVDGETNWHDQQDIAADRFYRERRNGGEWGPAIELIEGKTGVPGAAAGFGTPSVTVETLPAESDATASVAASGDDAAKVFSFSFGIPKGTDGQNGADGVSSYTYVAYASDASGTGFSLTPTNALKYRAEIHTTTAIETPDAEDFAGATWVKYLGDDGDGAGDMLKSVYDTNDDGIVDHAATADTVGATTAAQVADAVSKAHAHANKATLDKLAETDGKLAFDGAEIGGASNWNDITGKPETFPPSAHNHAITDVTGLEDALQNAGSVKSVNGQLPDESGNVTVETGSTVDESRLLPALDSVPVDRSGNPVVFKAVSAGMDKHTLLYCPFDADFNDHSSYARTVTHDTSRAGLSISLERNKFGTGSLQGTGYTTAGAVYVLMSTPIGAVDFTIHKWIYVTSAADRFGIFSTYGEAGSGTGTPGYGVDGLACWIDTDGTLKLYKASAHFSSYWYDDDSGNKLAEAAMPSDYLNRWVHIAVARSGNIWMLFADGSLLNSNSKEFNATQPYLRIGSADSKATAYGNIDEFIVLDYAKWTTDFEPPTQPASEVTKSYEVSDKGAGTVDESRLLPENPANGDIPCFDATATVGGGNDANTRILLHFDADEIKDEAAGNAAPVTITKKTGTITVVEGGKWGKCAKYVTGSMTVATNLDELNANNWVVSGWFNPDENNHGVSYPTWLSMDDSSTNGFMFDSTGRYGESDGPLFYLDTPPAAGTWHWLAIVKYSGGLRFYLNGAFLNEISAQQRANFCSTLAIGGYAGTHAEGDTERTFSGLVDEVRLQYIPDDEIALWTGASIAVPDAPYSKPQTVGEWGKLNKSLLAQKSDVLPEWHQLSGGSTITLDRTNGELQKVTLTQNCTLIAPVLDADHPTMLLQVTSSSAVTVTVGETNIVTDHTGTFQVGWFYDGETTRRYPVVEVA